MQWNKGISSNISDLTTNYIMKNSALKRTKGTPTNEGPLQMMSMETQIMHQGQVDLKVNCRYCHYNLEVVF